MNTLESWVSPEVYPETNTWDEVLYIGDDSRSAVGWMVSWNREGRKANSGCVIKQVTTWQLWPTQLGASGGHAEHASDLSHLRGCIIHHLAMCHWSRATSRSGEMPWHRGWKVMAEDFFLCAGMSALGLGGALTECIHSLKFSISDHNFLKDKDAENIYNRLCVSTFKYLSLPHLNTW